MTTRTVVLDRFIALIQFAIAVERFDMAMKREKMDAHPSMVKTMAVSFPVSISALIRFLKVRVRLTAQMMIIPAEPIAPASVAVNHPANNPPIDSRKTIMISIRPPSLIAAIFSSLLALSDFGQQEGSLQPCHLIAMQVKMIRRMPGMIPDIKSLPIDVSQALP